MASFSKSGSRHLCVIQGRRQDPEQEGLLMEFVYRELMLFQPTGVPVETFLVRVVLFLPENFVQWKFSWETFTSIASA